VNIRYHEGLLALAGVFGRLCDTQPYVEEADVSAKGRLQLKVRGLSLAAEIRILKKLEKQRLARALKCDAKGKFKVGDALRGQAEMLRIHRGGSAGDKQDRAKSLRMAARSTCLATAFLRGTPYRACEWSHRPDNAPDQDEVERLVIKFGAVEERVAKQRIAGWLAEEPTPEALAEVQQRQWAQQDAWRARRKEDAVRYAGKRRVA
jgi:hypothetical protein